MQRRLVRIKIHKVLDTFVKIHYQRLELESRFNKV